MSNYNKVPRTSAASPVARTTTSILSRPLQRVFGSAGVLLLSVVVAASCQRDDAPLRKEVAELKSGQDQILDAIKNMPKGAAPGAARAPARPQRPRPQPESVYSVNVSSAPFRGAKDAKVTVVKAFEFACPFCQKVSPTLDQLLKDYEGDIKIAYKHFVVHPQSATEPALASCAGGMQGKWKEIYDALWADAFSKRDFSPENMDKIAKGVGLDMAKYKADKDGACKELIRKDQAEVSAVGTSGTPAFYINGRFLSGARPVDQFKALVDEELKKANDRIAKGEANVSNYYDTFVVKKGLKKLETK